MKSISIVAVVFTGILLFLGVRDFPHWGDPHSPANAGIDGGESVSQYYIENTKRDTGVSNIVTAVLADYRSYDTMFEVVVIFAAGIAVLAILRVMGPIEPRPPNPYNALKDGDHNRIIVGTTTRILVPVIQLFGLYVLAHGHHSPGGGFQGGVILGASFILLAISDDLETSLKRLPERAYVVFACVGILIYSGFGFLCQILDGNFLDYSALQRILPVSAEMARYYGILGVEVGVAFTVAAIMFSIYANLSSRGELKRGL